MQSRLCAIRGPWRGKRSEPLHLGVSRILRPSLRATGRRLELNARITPSCTYYLWNCRLSHSRKNSSSAHQASASFARSLRSKRVAQLLLRSSCRISYLYHARRPTPFPSDRQYGNTYSLIIMTRIRTRTDGTSDTGRSCAQKPPVAAFTSTASAHCSGMLLINASRMHKSHVRCAVTMLNSCSS